MLEDIRLAFQGIWSHKLRSALTMLGIIIGIGSIIAIVSTIKGTNEQIKKNLVGAGNNAVNIQLYQGDWTLDLSYQEVPDGIPEISDQVLGEIQALDEVESAALYHRRNEYDAVYAGSQKLASCNIFGIDSNYLDAYGFQITKGRGFSEKDFTANRKVVLLDKTTATALFPDGNVIGKIIEVKGEPFTVIGMMARKENSQPVINSMEDYYRYVSTDGSGTICIPDTLWPIIYQYDEPQNLVVRATSTDEMTAAGEKAADILNSYLTVSDETIKYKGEDLLEQANQIQEIEQLDEPAAALDCKHFTSGWRDRCYEYYAGVCDRKNERNRSEKGTGGKKKKNPDAVSDGSGSTYPSRRSDRCGRRDCACLYYFRSLGSSGGNQRSVHSGRSSIFHTDRNYFRTPSVGEGGEHESNRCTEK